MAISMGIGIYYFVRRGIRTGVDEDTLYNVALVAIVGGVIGARLIYVLTNWGYFAQHPGQIAAVYNGGLAIHGAILGGLAAGMAYSYWRSVPFWALVDGMVPGACIGIFLVRIGNIFNGEILGHPAAILGGLRHPAQVYEMVMALALWFMYWRRQSRDPADGSTFWHFMIWYSIFRFVSEMFRDNPQYLVHYTNHTLGIGILTLEQLFTPLILGVSLAGYYWRLKVDSHIVTRGPRWVPPRAVMADGGQEA